MSDRPLLLHRPADGPWRLADRLHGLVATPGAAVISLISAGLALWLWWAALSWLLIDATPPFAPGEACAAHRGACWPFLVEKTRFILFGTYPFDAQWRPALTSLLLCALSVFAGLQAIGRAPRISALPTVALWVAGLLAAFLLMGGGVFGLMPVDSTRWNGLPILLILSVVTIAVAFPLGMLLALARDQATYPLMRRAAAAYIEIMRGVPMVTVLFVGIFVLPLMLPPSTAISPVGATLIALTLFHASYFAEDFRSGLQSLPVGQRESAKSLGLSYWQATALVILPQAIHRSLPALLNSVIGAYKDTSLVVILGIHDLTATARMAFNDPGWRGHALEAYALVGFWFFVSCAFLSAIGRRLHATRWHTMR